MSAIDGCRNLSPSSAAAWTTIATIVDSERISWVTRRSAPLRLSSFVLMSSPSETARLARMRAENPAARLMSQNRCGVSGVVMDTGSGRRRRGAYGVSKTGVGEGGGGGGARGGDRVTVGGPGG